MISLEQIRLLEGKIAKAIDLIRILKEENGTLRKGLDSAQRRMKELEGLVDGFKTDQKEIETVVLRTLKNLDDLEEANAGQGAAARVQAAAPGPAVVAISAGGQAQTKESASPEPADPSKKDELDIF
jgi:FtsZ-binding cell division protein ZapB